MSSEDGRRSGVRNVSGEQVNIPSINASKWALSKFVTSHVFTYLVFDDLNDCSGVCKFFYSSVANTVKFMEVQGMFSRQDLP